MNRERMVTEAAAQLALEAVRLAGIQNEIIAHLGPVPEQLRDDLEYQQGRHQEAVGLVLRLSHIEPVT